MFGFSLPSSSFVVGSSLRASQRMLRKSVVRTVVRTYMIALPTSVVHLVTSAPSVSVNALPFASLTAALAMLRKKSAGSALTTFSTLPASSLISMFGRRPLIRSTRIAPLLPAMLMMFVRLSFLPLGSSTLTRFSRRTSS